MEKSINEIFSEVKELKNNWKFAEALDLITKLEKNNNVTTDQLVNFQFQKASLHFEFYQMESALKYSNLAYKTSQQLKNKKLSIEIFTRLYIPIPVIFPPVRCSFYRLPELLRPVLSVSCWIGSGQLLLP